MKKAVFGLVRSESEAQKVVNRLLGEGFSNSDISVLYYDRNKTLTTEEGKLRETKKHGAFGHEKSTKAPEGAATGAAAGGILGGSIGLLAGIGALAIPGLGPFIAAGPIMAALSGSAIGGSLGLLIGALIGLGIPEYEAKRYENSLKSGNILISVHAETYDEVSRAHDIMKREGAFDLSTTSEKAGTR